MWLRGNFGKLMTYLSLAWLIIFKASPWHVEEHRLEEESEADPLVVLVADRLLPLPLVANSWVSGQAVIVIQDSLGQSERWMNPKCDLQFKLRQALLKAFLVVFIKKLNRLNQNYVRVQCIKVENKIEIRKMIKLELPVGPTSNTCPSCWRARPWWRCSRWDRRWTATPWRPTKTSLGSSQSTSSEVCSKQL